MKTYVKYKNPTGSKKIGDLDMALFIVSLILAPIVMLLALYSKYYAHSLYYSRSNVIVMLYNFYINLWEEFE